MIQTFLIREFRDHGGCVLWHQKLISIKFLTSEVPSENAAKMCGLITIFKVPSYQINMYRGLVQPFSQLKCYLSLTNSGFYIKIQLMSNLLSFRTWLFCITVRSKAGVELVSIFNSTPFDFTHILFVLALLGCNLNIVLINNVGQFDLNFSTGNKLDDFLCFMPFVQRGLIIRI